MNIYVCICMHINAGRVVANCFSGPMQRSGNQLWRNQSWYPATRGTHLREEKSSGVGFLRLVRKNQHFVSPYCLMSHFFAEPCKHHFDKPNITILMSWHTGWFKILLHDHTTSPTRQLGWPSCLVTNTPNTNANPLLLGVLPKHIYKNHDLGHTIQALIHDLWGRTGVWAFYP